MLAKIQGVFRLTRDAELKYSQNNAAILNLGLACSEKYKDNEKQLFLDATAFGKAGELINQYAGRKGTQISLAGKLETQQWVDQSGNKRSKIAMTIEDFEFLGGRSDNQAPTGDAPQQQYQQQQSYQAPQQQQQAYQAPSQEQMGQTDDIDGEIPF